jgi:hypothetical protein
MRRILAILILLMFIAVGCRHTDVSPTAKLPIVRDTDLIGRWASDDPALLPLRFQMALASDGGLETITIDERGTRRNRGTWSVDHGMFCHRLTNWYNTKEFRYRVIDFAQDHFTYDSGQRVWVWKRKE